MATSPKDANPVVTKRQTENARANIAKAAGQLVKRLLDNANGLIEMTSAQVKSAQILLDRVVPTMQSIDQTTRTETPELSPAEIEAMLQEYVTERGTTLPPIEPEHSQATLQ